MGMNFFLLGLVVAFFGISMFLPARNARKRDQALKAWPAVEGTIISCEVKTLPPMVTKLGKQVLQYDVNIKYKFRSGGQLRFGSSLSIPRYLYNKAEAENIAARFPAGANVAIHHNPDDIQECYLIMYPSAKYYRTSIVIIAAGALLVVLGFLTGLI
jgi:hypothetical protein